MDVTHHHQQIEMYSHTRQQNYYPTHYQSKQYKVNPKMREGCNRRNDSSTTTSLYEDSTGRLHKKCYERNHPPINDTSQVKWSRNNIALTMEYFEPISSTSTPKRYSNQSDYSYAYYEPGAAMRHSNIPIEVPTDQCCSGPSTTRSSPKSIRSLLSTPSDDKRKSNSRHTFTTRYGTQENIYEDVSAIRIHPDGQESPSATPPQHEQGSKIEFQDILHNHYRVLEELNLSVEELFLSTTKKNNALSPGRLMKSSKKSRTNLRKTNATGSKNPFASSVNELVGEDSGFSGSSSGASYIGTLRNLKTALTRSHRKSTEINHLNNGSDCGVLQGVMNVPTRNSKQRTTGSLQMVNQLKGDKCSSAAKKVLKFPFWNDR